MGTTSSRADLCVRCQHIDFEQVNGHYLTEETYFGDKDQNGCFICDLGSIDAAMRESPCPLCRVFAAIVHCPTGSLGRPISPEDPANWSSRGTQFHLRAFLRRDCAALSETRMLNPPRVMFAICRSQQLTEAGYSSRILERGWIEVLPVPKKRRSKEYSPLLGKYPSRIEWTTDLETCQKASTQQIKLMLTDCQHRHSACRKQNLSYPRNARVIDCRSRKVVHLTYGRQYLALSYVWGLAPSIVQLEQDSNADFVLPTSLPQTIEDAIRVTLDLQYQYLWIDRYCIKQDDSEDKAQQIAQMANIYSCAVATLCATGPSDQAGIEGISRPREPPPWADKGDLRFMWRGRGLGPLLNESPWMTRAWTLQELVLSPRKLFFTSESVVMACDQGFYHESLSENRPLYRRTIAGPHAWDDLLTQAHSFVDNLTAEREAYLTFRETYLNRKLSHERDGLNAFQAILSRMQSPSYWGVAMFPQEMTDKAATLPLARKLNLDFIEELLWTAMEPAKSAKRGRGMLPSWSWISQTAPVEPVRISLQPVRSWRDEPGNLLPLYTARIDLVGHDRCVSLTDHLADHGNTSRAPELTRWLQIHSVTARWKLVSTDPSRERVSKVRFTEVSDPDWAVRLSRGESSIYFDGRESNDGSSSGNPSEGDAVLLRVWTDASCWAWLAIRKETDGTFSREGVIEWEAVDVETRYLVAAVASPLFHKDALSIVRVG